MTSLLRAGRTLLFLGCGLFQQLALGVDGEVDVVGFVVQFDAVVGIGGRFDEADFVNPVVGVSEELES